MDRIKQVDAHPVPQNFIKLRPPKVLHILWGDGGWCGWITARTNTQEILLPKEQENISSVFILRVMATGSTY